MKLGNLVHKELITVAPGDTISSGAGAMWRNRVGSVVVQEDGKTIGILTERDVLRVAAKGLEPRALTVRSQMTSNLITAPDDIDASEAARIMASQGIRHLPVTAFERVVGIVSMRDLLEVLALKLGD